MSLILANIKNMLLVVTVINWYVLMINLVHVNDKFSKPFTSYLGEDAVILLAVWLKKVNIVVMWGKNILTNNL